MAYYIWKSYKLNLSPLQIFACLHRRQHCFFLDSSFNSYPQGRFSFLGCQPFYVLKTETQEPFQKLREILGQYQIRLPKIRLPFFGGAVGYLGYDLGFSLESKIKQLPKPASGVPGSFFAFYNRAIIIDHPKKIFHLVCLGFPEKKSALAKLLCKENFKEMERLLSGVNASGNRVKPSSLSLASRELRSNFSREDYLQAVKKAKEYIRAGDIYQVNLSQRFSAKTALSPFQIYQRLRKVSPAHFSAFLDTADFQILSSSPERFLQVNRGGLVITRPMKGTRPRGRTLLQDSHFKKELLDSPKDKAELMMIVDLERNDLGKVCSYNTIKVDRLREMERYNTVFQTTATISGKLHKGKDRIDLLRAAFPGGSVTGCPKIRAMEIIEELEPSRRGIYTGSLGYLSFSQDMDFNILIRTILKRQEKIYFGVGGGVVADSEPQDEYQETLVKARAMLEAINLK